MSSCRATNAKPTVQFKKLETQCRHGTDITLDCEKCHDEVAAARFDAEGASAMKAQAARLPMVRCGCGLGFDRVWWSRLPFVGVQEMVTLDADHALELELRNCWCGTTLAAWVMDGTLDFDQEWCEAEAERRAR